MGFHYLSVCSGIEAATVAWHPLGWTPFAFSQFDPDHDYKNGPDFPSALLAFRYPNVPNLGDMTKFKEWPDADIDVLVGGTPCQSFSVAGLRKGLLTRAATSPSPFLQSLIDIAPSGSFGKTSPASYPAHPTTRPIHVRRKHRWIWKADGQEMDTEDEFDSEELHALNSILAGFSELGYGWALRFLTLNTCEWTGLDGLSLSDDGVSSLSEILETGDVPLRYFFEPESLSWNSAPRREAGQRTAHTISARPTGGGGLGTDFDCDGGLIAFGGNNTSGSIDVATALQAHAGPKGRQDLPAKPSWPWLQLSMPITVGSKVTTTSTSMPEQVYSSSIRWPHLSRAVRRVRAKVVMPAGGKRMILILSPCRFPSTCAKPVVAKNSQTTDKAARAAVPRAPASENQAIHRRR
ncbi:MAG: DNA cytosine methyltransferase [Pseudolabrys sp.]